MNITNNFVENKDKNGNMANTHDLFKQFNSDLQITLTKKTHLMVSRDNLRKKIKAYFEGHHPDYTPSFYIQGSYKMGTTIRTKDDTCDLDDGVYFKENTENVSCEILQNWVKDAVNGTTDAKAIHRKNVLRLIIKLDTI